MAGKTSSFIFTRLASGLIQMNAAVLVLCTLLWSLVEVHSQTAPPAPYLSFMNITRPNHAYVSLTLVGDDDGNPGNTVRCHTDLDSCCSGSQGVHRGDWYFPDGTRLQFSNEDGDIYEQREAQRVDLRRRNNANSPSGIYRCTIQTDADTMNRKTIYTGVYASGGTKCNDLVINQ